MKSINQILPGAALVILATASLSGCTGSKTSMLEADHGESVRAMVNNQIHNPDTVLNVDTDAPTHSDGQRHEAVLGTYRDDVSQPADVNQDIVINVGGGGSQ